MPAKKEKLREFNKNNIIESAKILFAEKGVHNTTMDDIAAHSEYSKTTLYAYFKSKDEIFDHVMLKYMVLRKSMFEKALEANPGFPQGYYALCDALVDFYESEPVYFEKMLGDIKFSLDEADEVLLKIYKVGEETNAIIEGYFGKHMELGNIHLESSPFQVTFTFWAALGGVIVLAHKKELYLSQAKGLTRQEFMKNAFEILLKSIGGGS